MNYDGPLIADALARTRHRIERDEALLRQALEALLLTQEGSELYACMPEELTLAACKDLLEIGNAIAALRTRLGTQPPADVEDRLARHGIPMPGGQKC
jgi:Arc/MetJ family transcription regulator